MNYLAKFKSILFLSCLTLIACGGENSMIKTEANNDVAKAPKESEQKKKSPLVLIDDNGKLGDIFKSGGDEIGSVNKYL